MTTTTRTGTALALAYALLNLKREDVAERVVAFVDIGHSGTQVSRSASQPVSQSASQPDSQRQQSSRGGGGRRMAGKAYPGLAQMRACMY